MAFTVTLKIGLNWLTPLNKFVSKFPQSGFNGVDKTD